MMQDVPLFDDEVMPSETAIKGECTPMSMVGNADFIDRVTLQCRIIVGALILGVVGALGVAMVVDLRPNAVAPANPAQARSEPESERSDMGTIITWVAVAFAAVTLPLSFVVPRLVAQQGRRAIAAGTWSATMKMPIASEPSPTDADKLAMVYQTQLIIGAAMNEGATFFAAISYLIGKDPIALGLGILLVGGLIARFPAKDRVALWIDRQQEQLILDKQAAI
jgi:hypothetical protein